METPFFVIPGLDPLNGPQAEAWLDRASELALAFSQEVHGELPSANAIDVVVIHLAAHALWRSTGGRPCWSKLDPDLLNVELADVAAWKLVAEQAFVSLYGFFCFLAKHGHLSHDAALRAQNRFLPWVAPAFEQLLTVLTTPRRPRTSLPTLLN